MTDEKPEPAALQDDPFEVLGLEKTATDEEIKAAHRKLALKCAALPSVRGHCPSRCPVVVAFDSETS